MHGAIGLLTGGIEGAAGATLSSALLPTLGEQIAGLNLPQAVTNGLNTAVDTALGALAGGASGAAAGANQAANNYISHSPFASVRGTASRENARLLNACGSNCTEEDLRRIDQQVAAVERAGNLSELAARGGLNTQQALQLGQVLLELAPFYGNGEWLLQLVTGQSSLTGEEANRFWAAIGLVPVAGGVLKKVGEPSVESLRKAIKDVGPVFSTTREATAAAEAMGYVKINETIKGQAIYKMGDSYITRDVDGHNGGAWKEAGSVKDLGSKNTRRRTFDGNLKNKIGP